MKNTKLFFFRNVLLWTVCTLLSVACSDDESRDESIGVNVLKIKLERNEVSMVVGTNESLVATITPENAENQNVTWSSNKPGIVSVDENGVLTALEVGTATIAVKTEDGQKVDFCFVTLTPAPVLVEGIELDYPAFVMKKGEKVQFEARVLPKNATNKTVTWSSSNESVVAVDEKGNLTAVDFGDATITVVTEDGAKEASCNITVDNKGRLVIETVDISAGIFQMGEKLGVPGRQNDETLHQVTLTRGFKMSKYEISNRQFSFFLNATKVGADGMYKGQLMVISSEGKASDWGVHYNGTEWEPAPGKEDFPVVYVTWYGATEFAAYAGGTLPTEAQWEYACRGGLEGTLFGLGAGASLNKDNANFNWQMECKDGQMDMSRGLKPSTSTMTANAYEANGYGLYNMHGNVREWCSDWYEMKNPGDVKDETDPTGPATGTYRIFRGGSWGDMYLFSRSSFRMMTNPSLGAARPHQGDEKTGFRVIMPL